MHAIVRMDENGIVCGWNRGAERIFGYSRQEMIGCAITALFTDEDVKGQQHVHEMEKALKLGYAENERWHVRKDRSLFWGSGITTPVHDGERCLGFLIIMNDKTTEKLANERLTYITRHDGLTGLPNRRMFHDELRRAIEQAKLKSSHVEVLFIDLDRFKEVNDTLGHHTGDLFLKEVASRLRNTVRANDLVARLSGDEFGVICKRAKKNAGKDFLAEKLVNELSRPYLVDNHEITSGASIGVTTYPTDSDDPTQILRNADLAMYAAKSSGRSSYRIYSADLDLDAQRRRIIHEGLEKALRSSGLMLHYQPQYSLDGKKLHGMEALLRWNDCPLPDVTSREIITVASETGLILQIGEWALREACAQGRIWFDQGMRDFRLAVNISSSQLKHAGFIRLIDEILAQSGFPAEFLALEITEFTLMENNQSNARILKSLKKKGIHLSVDDFGTGFSSLSSLKSFPVDALKIDQVFISELPQSAHDAAIASAIIGLAHSLNLEVVAECVESKEQADCLASLGCDFGQGYLYAPPAPAAQVARY